MEPRYPRYPRYLDMDIFRVMELGNMLSLMLLVTKIVLTTIRPGQNNLCIHWAEVLLMRPLSQPAAQPQPDTAHSTQLTAHMHSHNLTLESTKHSDTCQQLAMHALLFNSNWISDKKYKQTKHKSKATTSFQQLASYSSILCINALNCSNWFLFCISSFNWIWIWTTPPSLRICWVGDLTLSHTEAIGEPGSLWHASMHHVATHA